MPCTQKDPHNRTAHWVQKDKRHCTRSDQASNTDPLLHLESESSLLSQAAVKSRMRRLAGITDFMIVRHVPIFLSVPRPFPSIVDDFPVLVDGNDGRRHPIIAKASATVWTALHQAPMGNHAPTSIVDSSPTIRNSMNEMVRPQHILRPMFLVINRSPGDFPCLVFGYGRCRAVSCLVIGARTILMVC